MPKRGGCHTGSETVTVIDTGWWARQDVEVADLREMTEREYFASVSERPGMFIRRPSLIGLEAFLVGYDQNARRHGGPGLEGWRDWLMNRLGYQSNLVWENLVRRVALPDAGDDVWDLTPEKEAHVIRVLFHLLDEYIAQRDEARCAGDN